MPSSTPPPEPYQSALDLPSFAEMLEQLRGAKALTRVLFRKHRRDFIELEKQLRDLANVIDRFYELLGERQWVFHDPLSVDRVKEILDAEADSERAEQKFIEIYREPETLQFMIQRLRRFPAMRSRLDLILLAKRDYEEGRFYSTALVLLTVMDGFVNDLDGERRGLHTREESEMTAWDNVVGHHRGLSLAHRTFVKTTKKLATEEMFELQRHGIIHGMIINYDNVVVATKAWNHLFAVADWATSREKQREPKKEPSKLRETLAHIRESAEAQRALRAWSPSTLQVGDPDFDRQEVFAAAKDYLTGWRNKNFGRMAAFIPRRLAESSINKMAGVVREEFEDLDIQGFEILKLNFVAAAVCEVDVRLMLVGETKPGRMRWIREDVDGESVTPNDMGEWRLWLWGPYAIFQRAVQAEVDDT